MRICYAALSYPFGGGGISPYIYYVAHALAADGHDVHVIVVGDTTTVEEDNAVTVHQVAPPMWMERLNVIPFWSIVARSILISRAIRQLEAEGPLLVEFPDHGALGLSYLLRNRLRDSLSESIVKLHTTTKLGWRFGGLPATLSVEVFDLLERIPLKLADFLTAPSADIAQKSRTEYRLSRPVEVIPYPIDTDYWTPLPETTHGSNSENAEIVYAGRFEERKGIDILLDSLEQIWKRYPNVALTLVGSSITGFGQETYRDDIERKIKELSLKGKVRVLNWLSRDELRNLYRHATIVTVPSRYDNFPFACLEPMSCGTPVVAAHVGGIPEVLGEEGGLLVRPDDPEALAEAICMLLGSEQHLERLRMTARRRAVDEFSYRAIAPRTALFYETVLNS